jgi:hypothetical protein
MANRVDPAQRAAACERMRALAQAEGLSPPAEPSFAGCLRLLYEHSALPVREIAAIAGIIERTVYAHARAGGWTRRNWRHARYAGGRCLVPAEAAAFPQAGAAARFDLQAVQGTARAWQESRRLVEAAGAAAAAGARERAARLEAERSAREARRRWEARLRLWGAVNRSLDRLCDIQKDKRLGKDSPAAEAARAAVHRLLGQLERLRAGGRD